MKKRKMWLVVTVVTVVAAGGLTWWLTAPEEGREESVEVEVIPEAWESEEAAYHSENVVTVTAGQTAEASAEGVKVFPTQEKAREQRHDVEEPAEGGTEEWVARIIAEAKADPALKAKALQALGRTGSPKAEEYVAESLGDEDMAVMCAAITAWAELKGEGAIADIGKILEENRALEDGYKKEVATACVKALGGTMSSQALPALAEEMNWVSEREELPEYGLELIESVTDIGDSRGVTMLERYADELQGKLSGSPTVRRLQMLQIVEARTKAEGLR